MTNRNFLLILTFICTTYGFALDKHKINGTNKEYDLYGYLFESKNFFNLLLLNNTEKSAENIENIEIIKTLNDPQRLKNHFSDVIKVVEKIGRDISEKHKPWTVVVRKTETPVMKSTEKINTLDAETITPTKTIEQTTVKPSTPKRTESTTKPITQVTKTTEKPTSSQQDETTEKYTTQQITKSTKEIDVISTTKAESDKNLGAPMMSKISISTFIQIILVSAVGVLI